MGGRRGPMNIMPFPILIENTEAIGELRGQSIKVSTLAATSLLLVSRDVDKILPPTPSSGDRLGYLLCLRNALSGVISAKGQREAPAESHVLRWIRGAFLWNELRTAEAHLLRIHALQQTAEMAVGG
jgi:hypothetical protein